MGRSVGKTSLLTQYVKNTFTEDYRTTLGASILTKQITVDDKAVKLQIWDTGGQERFRALVSSFFKGSDGCMLAFDVTDTDSFYALEDWRQEILSQTRPGPQQFPFVVLGNKIDLTSRQVSSAQAEDWCQDKNIPYFEVSAKCNVNVDQAFRRLVRDALLQDSEAKDYYLTDSVTLRHNQTPDKRSCDC
uniref:Ras-related protein Rab-7b n=1 Tax=Callorhinchus milii TaxID=7868 RepID=A0A4W3H025_CALMI